jgi:hypothetical protein
MKLSACWEKQTQILKDAKGILESKGKLAWKDPLFTILYNEYNSSKMEEEFIEYCIMYNYVMGDRYGKE